MISVFADGSSGGATAGPGGYGWIIVRNGVEILDCGNGGAPVATNNQMELSGAIEGLKALVKLNITDSVELVSDSLYVLGLASGRYNPLKNLALAKEIRELTVKLNATTRWVKGHNGDLYNEKADGLAKAGKMMYTTGETKATKKAKKRQAQKLKQIEKRKKVREIMKDHNK